MFERVGIEDHFPLIGPVTNFPYEITEEIIEDEIIEGTNFNEKKVACKMQNFYILLAFLLITIAFLIVLVFTVILSNEILSKAKTVITILRHK